MSDAKLGSFLTEVSNWRWDEFHKAEHDKSYTTNQSIIFALVRSCAMQQMAAIKVALNRLDGKLVTPIKMEYPKIFYLYPNAKRIEGGDLKGTLAKVADPVEANDPKWEGVDSVMVYGLDPKPPVVTYDKPGEAEAIEEEPDLPSMGLRQTVNKMSDYPRDLPEQIIALATQTDQALRGQGELPDEIPLVKSVVAAHLLTMAQSRNMEAITEVFDQIDGKLAETIKLLGEDIFITSYISTAPAGAYLNNDGVLQLEAETSQDLWAQKLGNINKG